MTVLIGINIIPLARGGVHMLYEKEKDAVEIVGEIEYTLELPSLGGNKYGVEQNHRYGEGIVIDGTKYYLMTY